MRFVEYRVPSILEQSRRVLRHSDEENRSATRHAPLDGRDARHSGCPGYPHTRWHPGSRHAPPVLCGWAAGVGAPHACPSPPSPSTRPRRSGCWAKGAGSAPYPCGNRRPTICRRGWRVRGDVSAPELFLNAQGRVMTREGFAYVLRKYVRLAAHAVPPSGNSRSPRMCCVTPVP